MATSGRTNRAQRSAAAGTAHNLNMMAFNDLAAREAITFLVQGTPFAVMIEALQNLKLLSVGKFNRIQERHSRSMANRTSMPQSDERQPYL